MFCQLCGQPIAQGKLLRHPKWSEGQTTMRVCLPCFQTKPRCAVCDMPMGSEFPDSLCPTCEQFVPRCLTCGKPIAGRYAEIDGRGPYCVNCVRDQPVCDICGMPLNQKRWQLSDGRLSCESCHATAVDDPADARDAYDEVIAIITRALGLTLNVPTGLALVDRNQLADIIRKQNGSEAHDPVHTLGLYARRGIRRGIYVQSGLPRALLTQIAAHEYGHAWQGENCPLLRDPLIREGFAEWVAFKVLQAQNRKKEMSRMQARADLYGQGLQWALDVETREGAADLIERCRKSE